MKPYVHAGRLRIPTLRDDLNQRCMQDPIGDAGGLLGVFPIPICGQPMTYVLWASPHLSGVGIRICNAHATVERLRGAQVEAL